MPTTYTTLTDDQKARIKARARELFMAQTSQSQDFGHFAAWIANDLQPFNTEKATIKDAEFFAAVLTYLVFSGTVKIESFTLPQPESALAPH